MWPYAHLLGDDLVLSGDIFSWPHPTSLGEVLFMVDDMAEQAMKEVASRSHERVQATLAEMGIIAAMITRLGEEARRQMINDMEA